MSVANTIPVCIPDGLGGECIDDVSGSLRLFKDEGSEEG